MSQSQVKTPRYPLDPCRLDLAQSVVSGLKKLAGDNASFTMTAEEVGRLLEQPPESKLGDYALPCFRFAKDLKRKPNEIAEALASELGQNSWLKESHAVGAFLNIFTNKKKLARYTLESVLSGSMFNAFKKHPLNSNERVMIEFSQPNTHKEFHVGHTRNVCLGNSLVHLYRYTGYNVVSANYFGDDGTHIATVLAYLMRTKKEAPKEGRGEWLGAMYVEAKRELQDADEQKKQDIIQSISTVHREIETKTGDAFKLWLETRGWSLDDFAKIYEWLNVKFDVLFYESEVSEEAQQIVDEYLEKGVFVLDQGAIGVDLKPHKLGFCILRKRDGNTLYATKDLALARRKFKDYGINRSIYVVADEQNHHFKQVFKVLDLMGFAEAKNCHHLSYGMVVLPEGKMSSRDGTAVSFTSLKQVMEEHLSTFLAKYEGLWDAKEIEDVRHKLCDGAIKYGMISTDPVKEIVFNLADWLSFEGNSGPYLMYGYSRTQSILRKASENGLTPSFENTETYLVHASEHELLRYLYDFNQVAADAAEHLRPSSLATHLFYMTKAFNRFYAEVPVLKSDNKEEKEARLALVSAYGLLLKEGLGLLGITPPHRM